MNPKCKKCGEQHMPKMACRQEDLERVREAQRVKRMKDRHKKGKGRKEVVKAAVARHRAKKDPRGTAP
jgi:hypothetical protein